MEYDQAEYDISNIDVTRKYLRFYAGRTNLRVVDKANLAFPCFQPDVFQSNVVSERLLVAS